MIRSLEGISYVARVRRVSLAVGVLASAGCAAAATWFPAEFYPAYLVAYLFWLGVALGSWAIAMIHQLTGGAWGLVIRRVLESAYATMPLLAVLFLPIIAGMHYLYPWVRPEAANDPVLREKSLYLNVEFFYVRAAIYFAIWITLPWLLNRWSAARSPEAETPRRRWRQLLSGPGLLLYGLTVTFASIDWAMSLEPHWYSSMYGVIFMAGQAVSALSLAIVAAVLLADFQPWRQIVSRQRWHDLGNLLLALVMFWSYVAFMQYLIVWAGNLPEETPWYVHRSRGGWQYVVLILMGFHFAVPFLLLLSRNVKRHTGRLVAVALWLLVMRWVDLYWLIMPSFYPDGFYLHWLNLLTPLAIGGLWMAMFAWRLSARAQLPIYDPQMHEMLDETARHINA